MKFCTFLFHAFKYKFYNTVYCCYIEINSVIQGVIDCDYYYYYYYYYFYCYTDDNESDA
jgi:hypothetical protein